VYVIKRTIGDHILVVIFKVPSYQLLHSKGNTVAMIRRLILHIDVAKHPHYGADEHAAYKKIAEIRITGETNVPGNGLHKEEKVAYNTKCFKAKQCQ